MPPFSYDVGVETLFFLVHGTGAAAVPPLAPGRRRRRSL
jgi:hypothetical protein